VKIAALYVRVLIFAIMAFPVAAQDVFDRAERIIGEHRLLTPKAQRCSKLILRDSSDDRIGKIGVYEKHNKTCGGDPNVEHRLFDLEIDMKTGAAKWDNNPEMEMHPIPKCK
jgi:hypothetical protein